MRFENNVAHFLGNSWTVTRNDRRTFPHSCINFSAPYPSIPDLVQKMVDNTLETRDGPVYDCHIQDQLFLYAVRAGNDNIQRRGSLVRHNVMACSWISASLIGVLPIVNYRTAVLLRLYPFATQQ